ncbi:hypothetical protein M1555_04600 [Patescibacteria group bacterium]|nr:hypothetical protein [Patescibacteria group bacterium]
MPADCECKNETWKISYDDDVATVKAVYPHWTDHEVRLEAARLFRPKYASDRLSVEHESSALDEYDTGVTFTVEGEQLIYTSGGYEGMGIEDFSLRQRRLTPEKYSLRDHQTSLALQEAFVRGARRVVTSYWREGDDVRDIVEMRYDPEAREGHIFIRNTTGGGQNHTYTEIQSIAQTQFRDFHAVRPTEGIFLLTDIRIDEGVFRRTVSRVQNAELPEDRSADDRSRIREAPRALIRSESAPEPSQNARFVRAAHPAVSELPYTIAARTIRETRETVRRVADRLATTSANRKSAKEPHPDSGGKKPAHGVHVRGYGAESGDAIKRRGFRRRERRHPEQVGARGRRRHGTPFLTRAETTSLPVFGRRGAGRMQQKPETEFFFGADSAKRRILQERKYQEAGTPLRAAERTNRTHTKDRKGRTPAAPVRRGSERTARGKPQREILRHTSRGPVAAERVLKRRKERPARRVLAQLLARAGFGKERAAPRDAAGKRVTERRHQAPCEVNHTAETGAGRERFPVSGGEKAAVLSRCLLLWFLWDGLRTKNKPSNQFSGPNREKTVRHVSGRTPGRGSPVYSREEGIRVGQEEASRGPTYLLLAIIWYLAMLREQGIRNIPGSFHPASAARTQNKRRRRTGNRRHIPQCGIIFLARS